MGLSCLQHIAEHNVSASNIPTMTTNMISATKIDQLTDKVTRLQLQEDEDTDSENVKPDYASVVGGKREKSSKSASKAVKKTTKVQPPGMTKVSKPSHDSQRSRNPLTNLTNTMTKGGSSKNGANEQHGQQMSNNTQSKPVAMSSQTVNNTYYGQQYQWHSQYGYQPQSMATMTMGQMAPQVHPVHPPPFQPVLVHQPNQMTTYKAEPALRRIPSGISECDTIASSNLPTPTAKASVESLVKLVK